MIILQYSNSCNIGDLVNYQDGLVNRIYLDDSDKSDVDYKFINENEIEEKDQDGNKIKLAAGNIKKIELSLICDAAFYESLAFLQLHDTITLQDNNNVIRSLKDIEINGEAQDDNQFYYVTLTATIKRDYDYNVCNTIV